MLIFFSVLIPRVTCRSNVRSFGFGGRPTRPVPSWTGAKRHVDCCFSFMHFRVAAVVGNRLDMMLFCSRSGPDLALIELAPCSPVKLAHTSSQKICSCLFVWICLGWVLCVLNLPVVLVLTLALFSYCGVYGQSLTHFVFRGVSVESLLFAN